MIFVIMHYFTEFYSLFSGSTRLFIVIATFGNHMVYGSESYGLFRLNVIPSPRVVLI